jgi:hypothetical protein
VESYYKGQLADAVGIKYNTFMSHMNSVRPVFSSVFGELVLIGSASHAGPLSTSPILGPYIETTPVSGFDLHNLPAGQLFTYLADKVTLYKYYPSPAVAARELDNKVEYKYISRYINVDKIVTTTQGLFYFVMNPRTTFSTTGSHTRVDLKGVKQTVLLHDIALDLFVLFPSKAELSLFMYGAKNRGHAFDRHINSTSLAVTPLAFRKAALHLHKCGFHIPPSSVREDKEGSAHPSAATITHTEYYDTLSSTRSLIK